MTPLYHVLSSPIFNCVEVVEQDYQLALLAPSSLLTFKGQTSLSTFMVCLYIYIYEATWKTPRSVNVGQLVFHGLLM